MSFIEVSAESHFPIQNLPYGVFSTASNVRIKTDTGKLVAHREENSLPSSSLLLRNVFNICNLALAKYSSCCMA